MDEDDVGLTRERLPHTLTVTHCLLLDIVEYIFAAGEGYDAATQS